MYNLYQVVFVHKPYYYDIHLVHFSVFKVLSDFRIVLCSLLLHPPGPILSLRTFTRPRYYDLTERGTLNPQENPIEGLWR